MKPKAFATRAVHAGERAASDNFVPVASPIHPTVGFLAENMQSLDEVFSGEREGFVYPRYGSPTIAAFETAVADLESAPAALAFSSGMSAIHAALLAAGVRSGKQVVAAFDVYGATFALLRSLFSELNVPVRWVDVTDLEEMEQALVEVHPVALITETISNPLLKVANIPRIADVATRYGVKLLVDNTFASPYLFNPYLHGAHFVIHSATKYIAGHGDVMAGVVACDEQDRSRLYEINKLVGGVLGPFEAWLALRGLKTLPLRMRQQCENAAKIASWLAVHPQVNHVNYPGLVDHPQHSLASDLFAQKGYGGVLSFELAGGDRSAAFRFMDALQLCLPATTLGDLYTLVLHPSTASHRSLTPEERKRYGISEGLVRLSAGIEDAGDIIADLERALAYVSH